MNVLKRILPTTAILMLFNPAAIALENEGSWGNIVRELIKAEIETSGTPSIQVAIGMNNKLIFNEAYGLADVENNVEATPDTKYRIGSVSKWITATSVMALVDQGKIDLDLPIQTYCKHYPIKQSKISSRQLLNHTSGIRHYIDYEEEIKNATSEELVAKLADQRDRDILSSHTRYTDIESTLDSFKNDELLFEPGADWSYSSHAYRVLGCVLEGASQKNYRELVGELVFHKAKMQSTIDDDSWAIVANKASGYRLRRDKTLRLADMRDVSENLPAGGHLSTASDLILFSQAFRNGTLLSSESIFMMSKAFRSNRVKMERKASWRDAIPSKDYYGHGTMFFPGEDAMWLGHTGRIAGGSSIVLLHPEHNLSIAILTNAKGWNGYISFSKKIRATLEKKLSLLRSK